MKQTLPAYTADILSLIKLNCNFKFLRANFNLDGCEAVIEDDFDGQHYKISISRVSRMAAAGRQDAT